MSACEQGGVQGKAEAVNVKERQGMAQRIGGSDLPNADDVGCVVEKVLLREDGAFGLSRCA